jgi:hypothetical protein
MVRVVRHMCHLFSFTLIQARPGETSFTARTLNANWFEERAPPLKGGVLADYGVREFSTTAKDVHRRPDDEIFHEFKAPKTKFRYGTYALLWVISTVASPLLFFSPFLRGSRLSHFPLPPPSHGHVVTYVVVFRLLFPVRYTILPSLPIYSYPISPTPRHGDGGPPRRCSDEPYG